MIVLNITTFVILICVVFLMGAGIGSWERRKKTKNMAQQ